MAVSCHYLEKGNNTSELQTPLKVYRYFFAFLTILHSFLFFFFLSAVIDERKTLEVYKSTDGHDVMRLIALLAENGFALCTVGITQPLLCYGSDSGSQLIADFLAGIALKGGGPFVQTSSVTHLSEVINYRSVLGTLHINIDYFVGRARLRHFRTSWWHKPTSARIPYKCPSHDAICLFQTYWDFHFFCCFIFIFKWAY